MFRFACPWCRMQLSAPEECAGRSSKCRGCGQAFQVPTPPPPPPVLGERLQEQLTVPHNQWANEAATSVNRPATKYCFACAAPIDARAEICPKCGVRQPTAPLAPTTPTDPAIRQASGNKTAAGICGIFLGALGIHKFVLGLTTPGIIMLLVSVLTCGFGAIPMSIIGLVEGIIYLTKSDEDFYEIYVLGKKGWF